MLDPETNSPTADEVRAAWDSRLVSVSVDDERVVPDDGFDDESQCKGATSPRNLKLVEQRTGTGPQVLCKDSVMP